MKKTIIILLSFMIPLISVLASGLDEQEAEWQPIYGQKGELLNGQPAVQFNRASTPGGSIDPPTINTVVLSSVELTPAAMVEVIMLSAEAKAAALHECAVTSPISNEPATGTGTDSVAVACGRGSRVLRYCGKHVLPGEVIGGLVKRAVMESVTWDLAARR